MSIQRELNGFAKKYFWDVLDEVPGEVKIVCEDLNGHVGRSNTAYNRWHGGNSYGSTNSQVQDRLYLAANHDLAAVNTSSSKKTEHFITLN